MQIGLGIGIPFTKSQVWLAVQAVFTPAKLFDSGANGLWLDPGDLTTMFQDSAGTTPVTAVEQPVGLILDKSKGLVLGPELVTNGNFSNGTNGWSGQANVTISIENGELKGVTSSSSSTFAYQDEVTVSGKWYKATATLRCASGDMRLEIYNGAFATKLAGAILTTPTANTQISIYFVATGTSTRISFGTTTSAATTYYADNISVRELSGNHAFQSTSANRPTLSARYNQYVGTEAMATQNVTTLATSYKLTFSGAGSITLSGTATGTYIAGTYTVTCTAGTLTSTVSGSVTQASLVPANQSSLPYQRVNTATDYDSDATKFPWYLKFNGTSSSLQTSSINFTATDKMFVSAGVRKLSDAAIGILVELGQITTQTGGFSIANGYLGPNVWNFDSKGTVGVDVRPSRTAPITDVLTLQSSITSPTILSTRINGAASGSNTNSQGSGSFNNLPIYIGARAGTSLFFNGHLYQLVIVGKQASADEITSTETFINTKTKAY